MRISIAAIALAVAVYACPAHAQRYDPLQWWIEKNQDLQRQHNRRMLEWDIQRARDEAEETRKKQEELEMEVRQLRSLLCSRKGTC